ncbi:sensor histidine kinase [Pseudorhodoferax soli]|uniref:histidine kinase n=1 Tax=Pseudorhodoferax soli TaxID=545864 RepID=A0A368Y5C4_9BURK|nr:ATP-binding protein [Pseudorhodoferax soli]RCW75471.1 PAS domain S-box-containing protein [Pseudorhodoferax soli]
MKQRAWRLRSHLAALLLATMGLSFTVIVVSGLLWRLPQLELDSRRLLRQQTHDVAARMDLLLAARQARLILLAAVLRGDDAAADGALLQTHVGAGQEFQALYLLSPAGQVRALALPAAGLAAEWVGRDLSDNPLYRGVRTGRDAAWSGSQPSLLGSTPAVGLAYRRNDGAVLIGEASAAFLQEVMQTAADDRTSDVWLVDGTANIRADTEQGRYVGQLQLDGWPLLQAALAGTEPPGGFSLEQRSYWAVAVPATRLGWVVVGRTPAGWAHPAVRELLPYAAVVVAGSVAIGLWIASVWARRMSRSLQDILARAARTTAGAAAGHSWPRGSVREFNAVSSDLEGMAAALQARQQKFQAIFNAVPVAAAVVDADNGGRALDVNEAWCRVLGHRREDVLGRTAVEVGVFSAEQLARIAPMQGDSMALEIPMWRRDGQPVQMLSFGQRVRLPNAHWVVWTNVDVTALRCVERELQALNQELEQRVAQRTQALSDANAQLARTAEQLRLAQDELVHSEKMAALGALVAGVAHELNTPLGNGVMAVSAVADEARRFRALAQSGIRRADLRQLTDSVEQGIDIAQRNLRRAADLVQSFKQVAVDQTSARRRRFELGEVVHEMVVSLQPSFSRTPYRIETEVPATGLLLDSYPGALGQTIGNLIQNAALHGFDGRDHGTVRLSAGRADDGQFWLHVADDGKGIAPEHIDRIFEPFMTTRMGRGGSGLGLHISYNAVVNVLGGALTVHSVPGQGACFMLRLPSEAPQSAPAALEPLP